jgi:predicted enzyme related to lactoylglutathione lyase
MTGRTRLSLIIFSLGLLLSPSYALAQSDPAGTGDPSGENQQSGRFIWADLVTGDAEKAGDFYRDLFHWEIRKMDDRYFMASHSGRELAGIAELPDGNEEGRHTRWVPYVSSNDPDGFSSYAANNGGEILLPPKDIEGRGRFALLGDPEGAVFGVMKPTSGDPEEHVSEIGNWAWLELWGNSPGDLAKFYSRAGFQPLEDEDSGGKTEDIILGSAGKARAGIRKKTDPARESTWLLYIRVSDLGETVAKAKKLGGVMVIEASEIGSKYPVAVVADPTGGVFAVVELASEKEENN